MFVMLLVAIALPTAAFASLGGTESSVDVDRVRMQGALLGITRTDAYTVHEVRSATGTVVREYVSPAGTVFGVVWQGAWMPDLQALLGTYFAEFQQASRVASTTRKSHGPLTIRTTDLVVHMSGHARAFSGTAYAAPLVPQGIGIDTIK